MGGAEPAGGPAACGYFLRSVAYISNYGSIFDADFAKENIQIAVDKMDADGNLLKANLRSFPTSGSSDALCAGYYRVTYTITDQGKTNSNRLTVRVTGEPSVSMAYTDRAEASSGSGVQNPLGLWDGSGEKWYENGMYINNGGYVTYNVEGKDYK